MTVSENKSIKLSRKTITVNLRNNTSQKIAAWAMQDDLLACHKELGHRGRWAITHIPSGHSVFHFNGPYSRIRPMLAELSALLDWNSKAENITTLLYAEGGVKSQQVIDVIRKYETETVMREG